MPDELRAQLIGYLPLISAMVVLTAAFYAWLAYRSLRFLATVPGHPLKTMLVESARHDWYPVPVGFCLQMALVYLLVFKLQLLISAVPISWFFFLVAIYLLDRKNPYFFRGVNAFGGRPRAKAGEQPDWDAWFEKIQGSLDRMQTRHRKHQWFVLAMPVLMLVASAYVYWNLDRPLGQIMRMAAFEQQMTRRLAPWAEKAFVGENKKHHEIFVVLVRPAYQTRPQEVLQATQKALAQQHARRRWHIVIYPRGGKLLLSGNYQPEASHG